MTSEPSFRYRVEARRPGDFTEAAGPWRTEYMGSDSAEAMKEAQRVAIQGDTVRMFVEVRHG